MNDTKFATFHGKLAVIPVTFITYYVRIYHNLA